MISSSVFSRAWWRVTTRSVARLASRFALPAGALTIANIVGVVALNKVQSLLNGQEFNAEIISQTIVSGTVSVIIIIALMLWSFGMWLVRLTAVARCRVMQREMTLNQFEHAMKELAGKKMYLSKVWMIASLWLLLPLTPLSMLFSLRIAAVSGIAGETLGIAIPGWSMVLMNLSILFLLFLCAAFSFLVLTLSSLLSLTPRVVCRQAVAIGCGKIMKVFALTAIVVVLNLIASPLSLITTFYGLPPDKVPMLVQIALQVWLGICSCILWPLSVLPFCELIPADIAR
jgi:hypothetical protein